MVLTFIYWKAAVTANALTVAVAVMLVVRRRLQPIFRYVFVGTTLVSVIAIVLFDRAAWVSQARHDARLADMVDTLCAVDLPQGAALDDCAGSITNTGNGNSCRYLATTVVRGSVDPQVVIDTLEAQGFRGTELDLWGDPVEDGAAYARADEDGGIPLSLQASWQPQEDDLRCI